MYQAKYHGRLFQALAYETLERQFQRTSAVITNLETGAQWYADPTSLAAEADRRIVDGEDPESLVHRLVYREDDDSDEFYELSSSISLADYQRGGYTETYRTLRAVADGCWD